MKHSVENNSGNGPSGQQSRLHVAQILAVATLLGLIALGLAWELRLAPIRPGGSWLALKVLPLLAALRGMLHGRRYTFQWMSLAILLYLAEGLVRATSDHGLSALLATIEVALSALQFLACLVFAKLSAPSRQA